MDLGLNCTLLFLLTQYHAQINWTQCAEPTIYGFGLKFTTFTPIACSNLIGVKMLSTRIKPLTFNFKECGKQGLIPNNNSNRNQCFKSHTIFLFLFSKSPNNFFFFSCSIGPFFFTLSSQIIGFKYKNPNYH